ncbi:hypothetical protein EJ03DRAFT_330841 [Teratosphaeria nubilosa]|uniref:WKF domain-containing protein n=1 Tax=Teratosphaeria nubilosa TaxID=161662 RepID=A0A6G1KY54_9PEZI|nr:hypothetical protein EJ03DRAFT_330841 [Teratosphaeria nubilosa]
MAAQADSNASGQHVPAWKRLGLKLKYAKDTSGQPSPLARPSNVKPIAPTQDPAASFLPQQNKRQRDESTQVPTERPNKKGRKQAEISEGESKAVARPLITGGGFGRSSVAQVQRAIASAAAPSHTRFDDDGDDEVQEETAQVKATSARSKSVSFTPDTKNEDGFSAQNLFKAWASGEQEETTHDDSAQSYGEPPSSSTKQARKGKKAKSATSRMVPKSKARGGSSPEANGALPEYVEYVRQFYSDKSMWKFNKSKQNALLKNLFNIHRISPQDDDAIIAYVGGLQGANAVQRVLDEAESVLKELLKRQGRESDIDGMESREARRLAYAAALQREIVKLKKGPGEDEGQSLEEMQREVERSRRAEAIFAELLTSDSLTTGGSDAARPAVEHETSDVLKQDSTISVGANKRKRRKARTEVSSDESSSDSSSDSSSSESSSSESEDE